MNPYTNRSDSKSVSNEAKQYQTGHAIHYLNFIADDLNLNRPSLKLVSQSVIVY